MSIFNHFKHLDLSQGQETALTNLEAFLVSPLQVFMLKGYAGSGKTTLLKGLFSYLEESKRDFVVMASTGRAAKVLQNITGHGSTIHRAIYNMQDIEALKADEEDEAEHSFKFRFPINDHRGDNRVLIIDEASMISNKESIGELFTFGTGILLQDILTYARLKTTGNKIIFVGDPAQLPPVGDNESMAFKTGFFEDAGVSCEEIELKEVFRQETAEGKNLILENATKLRDLIYATRKNELSFVFDNKTSIKINSEEVASKYVELFTTPDLNSGAIICYSNAQAHAYNTSVREKTFPNKSMVTAGDLLMINSNNYKYEVELYNGDIAQVLSVSETTKTITTPVFITEGTKKVKKNILLTLREITILVNGHKNPITCNIFDNLLNSGKRDLTTDEIKSLYINFVIRFNAEQKINKEKGLPVFKVGSDEFKKKLKGDGLTNAVRVKYGYAITGHKSQGGEWPVTFVDYSGQASLREHPLRWCYTAATRARRVAYSINPPEFGMFFKLTFNKINQITSFPEEALSFFGISVSPFHKETDHLSKSMKYFEIERKLQDTPFSIKQVISLSEYLERYILVYDGEDISIQASRNKAGIFEQFKAIKNNPQTIELLTIINNPFDQKYYINYTPSEVFLSRLYSLVQDACIDIDIRITNINENKGQYYVNYFLKTSGKCSYIRFFFNISGQFSTAVVFSDLGENDIKLKLLIQKLSKND